jgi:probable O-glycosylation ligase (exosortase A-associated)
MFSKGLVFTYVLTYGGALASFFDPFIGLLIYICFSIVRPPAMWFFAVPPGNYSRIVAVALLIGWAARGFGHWQFHRGKGVAMAFCAYWLWSGLAAAVAPDQDLAFGYVEELSKIILPFFVGITVIDSMTKLKQLIWVIVLSQGYVAYELNLSYYEGYNRVLEEGFGYMDNNCVAIAMDTGVGMAFFLGLHSQGWWRKAVAFGSAVLMMHVTMIAMSRGGMMGLILTALVAFWLVPKRPKDYLFFLVIVLVGLRLAGPPVVERFMTSFADKEQRDSSAQSRVEMWAICWDKMLEEPVFGLGPNHWHLESGRHGYGIKEAHSLWLQLGAELGFPGLILLLLFYGTCVVQLWRYTRDRCPAPDPWIRYIARMVIASLVGFAVSAQFVSLQGLELPYYVTLVGVLALKLAAMPVAASARAAAPLWLSFAPKNLVVPRMS